MLVRLARRCAPRDQQISNELKQICYFPVERENIEAWLDNWVYVDSYARNRAICFVDGRKSVDYLRAEIIRESVNGLTCDMSYHSEWVNVQIYHLRHVWKVMRRLFRGFA